MDYELEMQYLEDQYNVLQCELNKTNAEIKDWSSRKYLSSKRIVVTRGIISNVKDVNERYRDKQVEIFKGNKKELEKGISYLHDEMVKLEKEYQTILQQDLSYGWSLESELVFR